MKRIINTITIFFFFTISVYSQTGLITGKITDALTKEPLIGANILINELDNVGCATDLSGEFKLKVPVGAYSVKISLIGYKTVVKPNVIVKTNSETHIVIPLSPTTLKMDEVVVAADYFDKAIIENNISTVSLGVEEVHHSPGSMQDFQRILQGMAGVSFSDDQTNELIVRGGSPDENLTILDNMELHSTNHYPNALNSGGPINMVNVELIQDVQFSSGGFISKYGDKLSSVLNINSRDGTLTKSFSGKADISMAGIGGIFEGNINGGKGSWLVSARKSYINLLAGSFGISALPIYYDTQFRLMYNLSKKHKLSLSGIYGNDKINFEGLSDNLYPSKSNITDSIDVQTIDVKQHQWAAGISLNSVWSKNINSVITFYGDSYYTNVDYGYDFTERKFDNAGSVEASQTLNRRHIFFNENKISETALKAQVDFSISDNGRLQLGGQVKFVGSNNKTFIDADTSIYDTNNDNVFETYIVSPEVNLTENLNLFNQSKTYFYVNYLLKLFNERLLINIGSRYDAFNYSRAKNISPRFSATYYITPMITNINFAYGEYYQTQALPLYYDKYNLGINRFLLNSHAQHFVLGAEHIFAEGLRLTLETYCKHYSDLPVKEKFIHQSDVTYTSDKIVNVGNQDVYGIDLMLQQKLVENYYGTFAFSRMWTSVKDPRIGKEGEIYISDYDFPYVVNLIVGKRFKDARKFLDQQNFIVNYMSRLFPISDDMEFSVKWRYASGKPYTEKVYDKTQRHRAGGVTWTEGVWRETENKNGLRYPDYNRFDIAFNSRFNFSSWNLVINLSIQNILNHKNIAMYQYNSDGTKDIVYQFAIMPVLGLNLEF